MNEINAKDININFFKKFREDSALVVVENNDKDNAMTIGWGSFGSVWSKPTMSIYIKNTRYTKHMIDNTDLFSVSFFSPEYKSKVLYCGKVSRSSEDKISKCNFTRIKYNDVLCLKEAEYTFILKKIYSIDLPIDKVTDSSILKYYVPGEFHTEYICEIVSIIKN